MSCQEIASTAIESGMSRYLRCHAGSNVRLLEGNDQCARERNRVRGEIVRKKSEREEKEREEREGGGRESARETERGMSRYLRCHAGSNVRL
jgi:hypothetical protein